MRLAAVVILVAVCLAPTAQSKLMPTFSEQSAQPGDTVTLDLGEGTEMFLGPLRLYLAPVQIAGSVRAESDPRLVKIGELGTAGKLGTPSMLAFSVPVVPAGAYAAAVWFENPEIGRSAGGVLIDRVLTIRSADGAAGEGGGLPLWRDLAAELVALLGRLLACTW